MVIGKLAEPKIKDVIPTSKSLKVFEETPSPERALRVDDVQPTTSADDIWRTESHLIPFLHKHLKLIVEETEESTLSDSWKMFSFTMKAAGKQVLVVDKYNATDEGFWGSFPQHYELRFLTKNIPELNGLKGFPFYVFSKKVKEKRKFAEAVRDEVAKMLKELDGSTIIVRDLGSTLLI